ncbi:hypothetical protein H0A36_26590 [Endozoicomonas sp. SM1973]|uniref:Uncharacterized protein n=1 Tax=Spartinivicinus marinus TaxID=2994442 RepID=A0A853IJL8_9GAMM|nr:hypothetical protein [Spartinivicinus marinus]MCX4030349.1 hypothetical protein [Spartinivicinus marinus]MCX4030482.1 hypothetical protein [Spartinivicinus marinus]NYZ69587.1 hypothetical protein [Spartinivicinus marinus]
MNPFKGVNFRHQDREFAELRRQLRQSRGSARRTLSPNQIRMAIRTGEMPPNAEVLIGTREDGTPFTIEDLTGFAQAQKRLAKQFGSAKGVPTDQLIASSRAIDVERANLEIRSARLYKIHGSTLTFSVTASGKYQAQFHQVKVRLEDWWRHLTDAGNVNRAMTQTLAGPVSFDCDCGRHQFWYRYVATVGGFAIQPYEKDFPKVRNPQLRGCCCKHVLKVFRALKSPTVKTQLTQQMIRQAEQAGFAGDTRHQFMTRQDHQQLSRARVGELNQEKIRAELARQANLGLRRHVNTPANRKKINRVRTKMTQQLTAQQRAQIQQELAFAQRYNIPANTVYQKFADELGMSAEAIQQQL